VSAAADVTVVSGGAVAAGELDATVVAGASVGAAAGAAEGATVAAGAVVGAAPVGALLHAETEIATSNAAARAMT